MAIFIMEIIQRAVLLINGIPKKGSSMKCSHKNCKMMNSCLDFEEEMEEGVENTWGFMKELLL